MGEHWLLKSSTSSFSCIEILIIKHRERSRGISIAPPLSPFMLKKINCLILYNFYFFGFSCHMAGVVHLKLHIQQNKALLFQVISKINVFSIAAIIQYLMGGVCDPKNRLWKLTGYSRLFPWIGFYSSPRK